MLLLLYNSISRKSEFSKLLESITEWFDWILMKNFEQVANDSQTRLCAQFKKKLECLFYMWNPNLHESCKDVVKLYEQRLPSLDVYVANNFASAIPLTSCVSIADTQRLQKLNKHSHLDCVIKKTQCMLNCYYVEFILFGLFWHTTHSALVVRTSLMSTLFTILLWRLPTLIGQQEEAWQIKERLPLQNLKQLVARKE